MPGPSSPCTYSISPYSAVLGSGASAGNIITVHTNADDITGFTCPWTASCPDAWVTITTASGIGADTGPTQCIYSVSANLGSVSRVTTITVAGIAFMLTQLPGACTYSLAPLGVSVDATAHVGQTTTVTTQSACPWVATCPDAWITLTAASGTGSGNVVFNIALNAGAGRNSTITVNGIAFTVTQSGSSCTFQITPPSASFTAAGGSTAFSIVTQVGCAWAAVSSVPWITITSAASGTGQGTIGYAVAPNYGSALSRVGTITVAGLTFMVSQAAGAGAGFAVPPPQEIVCVNGTTRPMMRDRIRRAMGVTPPADTLPLGVVGEAPMGQPTPTNAEINQGITDAIRWVNDKVGFKGSTAVTVSVPAFTGTGPQYIPLTGVGVGSGSNQNNVDAIQKAVWNPGSGQSLIPLFATSQEEQDRLETNWDNQAASVPRYYLSERYQVGVLPGAQSAGVLQLYCTTAIYDFCSDTDVLNALPVDYEGVLEDTAVWLLSQRRPQEPGAQSRIQFLGGQDGSGEFNGVVAQGIRMIGEWYNDNTPQAQRSVGMTDFRSGYGTRRIRR